MAPLQFAPWTSDIELAFYAALASLKVNHDKLDDSARRILGLYQIRPGDRKEFSTRMQIFGNAFRSDEVPHGMYRAEGMIRNVNTLEDYKALDRSAIIERAGRTIWEAIHDGTILECPSLLASFTAICFADLKKHRFTYHFAFPALHGDSSWKIAETDYDRHLSKEATIALVDKVQTWNYANDARQRGFFLAKRLRRRLDEPTTPAEAETPGFDELGYTWVIGSLRQFEHDFFVGVAAEDKFICFSDPSTYELNPGWPLRNLLILMRKRWGLSSAQILCYRDTHAKREQPNSLILKIDCDSPQESPPSQPEKEINRPETPPMPKVVGWERDLKQKLNSRTVDLKEYMDPQRLADQAVDLNLKLIKWRIAPSIDLDIVKDTKCLLLGAGTLGSYVARNLMGWGVRKITFVDNAKVSYSNPVRQPLFDFKDCLEGGAPKAERAAEAIQEIYPGVESEGYVMSVPMAGHPISAAEEKKVKKDFETIHRLIEEHDAIFLLMDTRESRWLPTVMGKAAGKIVMNAALGFDTYVVMRHGLKHDAVGSEELGCYFCNDVVAPADSLKDATLDQQCTVTRPGVAPIASALLVELLVSIVQHPLKAHAPAYQDQEQPQTRPIVSPDIQPPDPKSTFTHPLGALPHSIRGFLNTFSNMQITGRPYDCCSACSDTIIDHYKRDGWNFVKRAINEKGWVEEISGLAEVQRRAEELDEAGWSEDDEDALRSDEGEGELI